MSKSVKKIVSIGGILAAPFTGGASLALTAGVAANDFMSAKSNGADYRGSASTPSAIPTAQDPEALAAREDQKRRQAAAAGLSANVLTGAGGLKTQANTGLKSLLGS